MFFFKVNTSLIPIKLIYFFYFGATAPIFPFQAVIAQQLGFSHSALGVVFAVVPLVAFFAKPAVGALADFLNSHKTVFLCSLTLDALFYSSIHLIPPLPKGRRVELISKTSSSFVRFCAENSSQLEDFLRNDNEVRCSLTCNNTVTDISFTPNDYVISDACYDLIVTGQLQGGTCGVLNCTSDPFMDLTIAPTATTVYELIQYSSFWLLLTIISLNRFSSSVVVSIADTICFKALQNKPLDYGCQRLWGAVSYGITGTVSSALVDIFSDSTLRKRNYAPAIYTSVFMFAGSLLVASRIKVTAHDRSPRILSDLAKLISSIDTLVFIFITFVLGAYSGIAWVYLFIYIEAIAEEASFHGWIATLEGLVIAVQCISEIPAFIISPHVLKKIGHRNTYSLILAAWAVRLSSFYFITNPWFVLPIEIINAVTFGLFYAAMTTYADSVAPRGAEAAVQGVTSAVFEGAGVATGGLLGGFLIDLLGVRTSFLSFGLSALGLCLFHMTFHKVRRSPSTKL